MALNLKKQDLASLRTQDTKSRKAERDSDLKECLEGEDIDKE